jgi:hypothetical protein
MWRTGDRALIGRPGEQYLYPATVQEPVGDTLHVAFDDGAEARVPAWQARPLEFGPGDRVEVRLPAGRQYSPATVQRRDGDRLCVTLDGGDQEWTTLGMVRAHVSAPRPTAAPAAGSWIVGDRVLARWGGDGMWYPGTVQGLDGRQLHIAFDDGDKELMLPDRVAPLELPEGTRVQCRWKGGRQFFGGRITQRDGEKLHVKYDDGDEEWTTASFVRLRLGAPIRIWKQGERVLARWGPEPYHYPGTVGDVAGDVVSVQYDDGDSAQVGADEIEPLELRAGDRVQARRKNGQQFYPGRVTQIDGARVHVAYDDGEQEWTTVATIRVLPHEQRR